MEESTAASGVLIRAVHDEALTRDKHTRQGRQVIKALRKRMEVHVFNDGVDLRALERLVWTEGTNHGTVGTGHRLEFERFVWQSPTPVGMRVEVGTADLPLSWVEIKGKMQRGVWTYHLTPRRRPPA